MWMCIFCICMCFLCYFIGSFFAVWFVLFCFFIVVVAACLFSKETEKKKVVNLGGWEMWRIRRNWGKRNCDQNILDEKNIFSIKIKIIKKRKFVYCLKLYLGNLYLLKFNHQNKHLPITSILPSVNVNFFISIWLYIQNLCTQLLNWHILRSFKSLEAMSKS